MRRYEVLVSASADKELGRLPATPRQRIIDKFGEIGKDPRGTGSKKLNDKLYRARVGDYRIVYEVRDAEKSVVVTRVRHRRELYRRL